MATQFGKLILVNTGENDQEFELSQALTTIGSAETNDIVIRNAKLSRAHARVECSEAGCTIFDLESTSGVLVNNQSIQQVNLVSGDAIKLGTAELRFEAIRPASATDATILDEAVFAEALAEFEDESQHPPRESAGILVPLQTKGKHAPFFCVVARHKDIPLFATLANHLGQKQPFYALQPPPRAAGDGEELANLDVLSGQYIDHILATQPEGPYTVGGFNMGGLIAFEIAQQLQTSGHEVALVVLIDTPYLVKNPLPYWGYRSAQAAKKTGDTIFQPLQKWYEENLGQRLEKPLQDAYNTIQDKFPQIVERLAEDQKTYDETIGDQGYEATVHALQNYQPQPYSGKIALYLAEQSWVRHSGALWGWHNIAPNGLDVYTVPGTYINLLKEPNVEHLAQQLHASLVGQTAV